MAENTVEMIPWLLLALYAIGWVITLMVFGFIYGDDTKYEVGFVIAVGWPLFVVVLPITAVAMLGTFVFTTVGIRLREKMSD